TAFTIRSLAAMITWRSAVHATNCNYAPRRTIAADQAALHRPAAGRSADFAGADGGLYELCVPADRPRVWRDGPARNGNGLGSWLCVDGPERGGASGAIVGREGRAAAVGRADVGQRSRDVGQSWGSAGARI